MITTKYISPKLGFLKSMPALLSYVEKMKFDLESIISIEKKDFGYAFNGLRFSYHVQTDSRFSFFRSNLIINEIQCEAS